MRNIQAFPKAKNPRPRTRQTEKVRPLFLNLSSPFFGASEFELRNRILTFVTSTKGKENNPREETETAKEGENCKMGIMQQMMSDQVTSIKVFWG